MYCGKGNLRSVGEVIIDQLVDYLFLINNIKLARVSNISPLSVLFGAVVRIHRRPTHLPRVASRSHAVGRPQALRILRVRDHLSLNSALFWTFTPNLRVIYGVFVILTKME